jgi:hypothetical protein
MRQNPNTGLSYALYSNDGSPNAEGFNLAAGYVHVTGSGVDLAVRSLVPPPLNTWTHLAVTYNGALEIMYVNGVEAARRTVTTNIVQSNGALRIGGNDAFSSEFFRGMIDEVRVYNRARTAAQISVDMNTPIVR